MYVYVFVLNKLSRLEACTHTSFFYFKWKSFNSHNQTNEQKILALNFKTHVVSKKILMRKYYALHKHYEWIIEKNIEG